MRIKIIKNSPPVEMEESSVAKHFNVKFSDISHLIGQEFEVVKLHSDGVVIELDGEEKIIFYDEFEKVE